MALGLALWMVGSTAKMCGWVIWSRHVTRVGMPRVFSKTGPGTRPTNSVRVEPGILTRPPKAHTVVCGNPGGSTWDPASWSEMGTRGG